ncbi:hypothetical protein POM88_050755 [Heracleum sosnowskyi]|uniref:cyclin-dependent kinase n=1 Tax=Heracleum sosnowskyi TaxID=360622 RepID=A0AAD8M2R6_9APIA|nr:hypothetical protein POM88_050755 [Heracleum sosnowskyi]
MEGLLKEMKELKLIVANEMLETRNLVSALDEKIDNLYVNKDEKGESMVVQMEGLLKEMKELKLIVANEMLETRNLVSALDEKIDNLNVNKDEKGESHGSIGTLFMGDPIGEGSKGTVFEVTKVDNNKTYSMKVICYRLTPELAREISALYEIKHENVMELEDVTTNSDTLYLFMEHGGVDLNTFLQVKGKQKVEIIKNWRRELLSALEYVHKRGLIHRDLKPENIMIGSNLKLKIADFGSASTFFDDANLTPAMTTLPFRAPELLLGSDVYGKEIDIWSVGFIFAEMVEGKDLFGSKDRSDSELGILHEIFSKIGTPSPQSWLYSLPNFPKAVYQYPEASQIVSNLDTFGNDLIKKMLAIDPRERITAEDALNHPYLRVSFSAFKPLLFVEAPKVAEAVQFYKSVFGAEEVNCVTNPKGEAGQELPLICALKLASTTFLISNHSSDPLIKTGGAGFSFLLETEDIEAAIGNALKAGAVSVGEGECCGSREGSLWCDLGDYFSQITRNHLLLWFAYVASYILLYCYCL